MTARASDSMFLFIDFVRVTNCFYDYDYDYQPKLQVHEHGDVCRVECLFSSQLAPVPIYTAWYVCVCVCVCVCELLLPEAFFRSKFTKYRLTAELRPDPLGELTPLPSDPLA